MTDFTPDINNQVLTNLGYTGDFSDNSVNTFLTNTPSVLNQYETMRKGYDSTYSADALRKLQTPGTAVTEYMANQVQTPTLPKATELVPTLQSVQQNELLQNNAALPTTTGITGVAPVTASTIATPAQVQTQAVTPTQVAPAATANIATIDQNAATSVLSPTAEEIAPTKTSEVTMQAAQGTVQDLATVRGQLASLFAEGTDGAVPVWAQGAYTKANEAMAARGIGGSSISAGAITTAYMASAINIAASDATTYFNMDLQNLNNKQQASLTNTQNRQQSMLTDVAADNAAKQFNAQNKTQLQQFTASLITNIQSQNATMTNSMSQFNTAEVNKVSMQNALEANKIALTNAQMDVQASEFNVQQKSAIDTQNATLEQSIAQYNNQQETAVKQFNSQQEFDRNKFNSEMQFAIDQSNVNWRRTTNTANTAAINASNQTNVQNRFNLSQTALNNVWQQWRDEAQWAWSSSESALDRNYNLAVQSNNQAYANSSAEKQSDSAFWSTLGSLGIKLLS